jgi:putative hemolysin
VWGIELTVIALMIAVNAVFAGYEIALASVTLPRLRALEEQGRPGAATAVRMKEGIEGSLAAIQLGITLVGAIAAATGGASAMTGVAPWLGETLGVSGRIAEVAAIASVVIPITAISIVFGELLPKVFALRHKEWLSLKLSPVMQWFARSARPVVWLLERSVSFLVDTLLRRWQPTAPSEEVRAGVAVSELRGTTALARRLRLIGRREERIILAAAALRRRAIREILLPAQDIAMLHADDSLIDALLQAHMDMHTRFPVSERRGDPQSIAGYVCFKDIVIQTRLSTGETSLRGILRPIPSLLESTPIGNALEVLMREHSHIALVRDARNAVTGMIALEDIIEELVGEIEDEFDRLPTHAVQSGPGWLVGGGITLGRLRDATGIDFASRDGADGAQRLTDWVCARQGGKVQGGEVLDHDGLRLMVRKVRRQKLQEAYLANRAVGGESAPVPDATLAGVSEGAK